MSGPFLQVSGLTRSFGPIKALDAVAIDAAHDELLVVLGPTGAGKTTLLRTIAGLETPDAGRIAMQGRDILDLDPAQRDVALVFQNFSLYPNWSVRKNLEFPLKAPGRNLDRRQIVERVAWAASVLRIADLLDRDVTSLSGGQMQRVAIGRAIVRKPRMFLMDEPLTNLDAKLREALRVELVSLRRSLAVPMIFVTHDQAEALSMADRIAVLDRGRILQVGTPEQVYQNPVSTAVARQLGQPKINLIRVACENGMWIVGGQPAFQARHDARTARIIGIRPENFHITGGRHPAVVRVVEEMGPCRILLAEWLGEPIHIIAPQSAAVRPGDTIYPDPDPAAVLAWDR
ncbi:MAG: ABC transporter ATP-binding protein [Planctomycetes bacterium]|nr:ABC transporter ATP-binding protein [Planctomycetota bacterium]